MLLHFPAAKNFRLREVSRQGFLTETRVFTVFSSGELEKMPKKPAVRAKPVRAWHVRAREAATSHPAWSATALAGAVIALVVLLGQMRPGLEWLADHWETPEATKRQVEELRREVQRGDDALKREADAHAKADDRRGLWLSYSVTDLKVTLLRNRLRDCKEKLRVTPAKAVVDNCDDYEEEYKDALKRAEGVYKSAVEASK